MPWITITKILPATLGARTAVIALSVYVYVNVANDAYEAVKAGREWTQRKLKERKTRVENAAREGAREGVKEAQATAA
jgi:predicted phage tail protein